MGRNERTKLFWINIEGNKMQVSNNPSNFEKFTKKKTAKPSYKLITRKKLKLETMWLKALRKFIENNQN